MRDWGFKKSLRSGRNVGCAGVRVRASDAARPSALVVVAVHDLQNQLLDYCMCRES